MKKYLNFIKHKNLILFVLIIVSILTVIFLDIFFYILGFLSNKLIIILGLLILGFVIVNLFFYGLLGLISSLSILLFFILMLTLFKFLEINFSWSVYSALLIGTILVNNNCLFLLEKIKVNFLKKWEIKKAFETAQIYFLNSSLDKNVIIFIFGSFIFLFNNNDVSTIGAVFVIISTVSFIVNSLINQFLIKLLITIRSNKKSHLLFGFNPKIKVNNDNNIFISKSKYIKYIMWTISVTGLIIMSVLVLIDSLGTDLFQSSSLIQNMSQKIIINGVLSLLLSFFTTFIYITLRYHWNFALALLYSNLQELILFFSLFVIIRMTINPFFMASALMVFMYSTVFSIDNFQILKNKVDIHIGKINKDILYKEFNSKIKDSILRLIILFYFMLISSVVMWNQGHQDIFIMGAFVGFIIAMTSSKIIIPVFLVKFELLRLKYVEKRTRNNFWKTYGKEEELINGINDYKI